MVVAAVDEEGSSLADGVDSAVPEELAEVVEEAVAFEATGVASRPQA